MPRKSVGLTTLRRNIERDSHAYYIEHKTHRLIKRLAKQEKRTTSSFLDVLIEQIARERLPAGEVEQAAAEGDEEEQRRRQEAEANQDTLLAKRQGQQQRKAGQNHG